MRRVAFFTLLLLAAAGVQGLSAQAVNVTGTWEFTSETPRGTTTTTVVLTQEGTTVTGTVRMAMGGRPGAPEGAAPREIPIQDGKVEGDKLTFSVTMGMGERSFQMTYSATVKGDTGDTMEGTMTGGMGGGDRPFTGKRIP